ncbi:CdaR family protein [Ligilactobacillus equi]
MKKNFWTSKIFYRFVSLAMALFLFLYVNSQTASQRGMEVNKSAFRSVLKTNKTFEVTTNLKLNYDDERYVVQDAPETVKLKVTGSSALVTAMHNTQNFTVYADLNNLSVGKHTVKLKTSGISRELSVDLNPDKITVKISRKAIKKMQVQARFDSNQVADGYAAGIATLSRKSVTVTGAKSDVKNIANVVADVNLPDNTRTTVTRTVDIVALDKRGQVLPVEISPSQTTVTVPIEAATITKKLPLKLVASDDGVSGKNYSFSSETTSVMVTGTKAALDKINSLRVPISVAGITSSTSQSVRINPSQSGITAVSPASIEVEIYVTNSSETASSSNTETSSAMTQSSNTSKQVSSESSEEAEEVTSQSSRELE